MKAMQATMSSLDASILALKTSYNRLSETMGAIHEAIKENHFVQMPSKLVGKESDYFELETEIDQYAYHVLFNAHYYDKKNYDIEIVQISRCLIEELEYKIIRKIEKSIHDKLLNKCDIYYYDKHFDYPDYDIERLEGEKGNY